MFLILRYTMATVFNSKQTKTTVERQITLENKYVGVYLYV